MSGRGAYSLPAPMRGGGIEHRLFPFISQNWRATPLVSYRAIIDSIAMPPTSTSALASSMMRARRRPEMVRLSPDLPLLFPQIPFERLKCGVDPAQRYAQ